MEAAASSRCALRLVKVDWALREPIPWADPDVREAGTVHVVESLDLLSDATVAYRHLRDDHALQTSPTPGLT